MALVVLQYVLKNYTSKIVSAQLIIVLSFSIAVPCVYGLIVYKHLSAPVQLFVWLLSFGLATEVAGQLARLVSGYNLEILNIYNVARAVIMGLFFYKIMPRMAVVKWVFVGLASVAIIEPILHVGAFASVSAALINMAVFFACLYCYMEYVSDKVGQELYWLLGVVMFYHLSGFMYLTFWGFIKDPSLLYQMAEVWALANFVCNLMYVFALWKSLQYSTLSR